MLTTVRAERVGAIAVPAHRKADTTIWATGSDLLLWLTNHLPFDVLEVSGPLEVATQWTQPRR